MRTSESITALVTALVKARPAFGPVKRESAGQVGSDRKYKYADLSEVLEATMPALTAQGLAVFQVVDAETSTLITRVVHTSGEWAEATYPLKIDLPPQQLGSLITYGRRYSLQSLLCIAAEDDDAAQVDKGRMQPKVVDLSRVSKTNAAISEAQRKRLFAIAKESNWTKEQIKNYLAARFQIDSTKDISAAVYDEVCEALSHPLNALQKIEPTGVISHD